MFLSLSIFRLPKKQAYSAQKQHRKSRNSKYLALCFAGNPRSCSLRLRSAGKSALARRTLWLEATIPRSLLWPSRRWQDCSHYTGEPNNICFRHSNAQHYNFYISVYLRDSRNYLGWLTARWCKSRQPLYMPATCCCETSFCCNPNVQNWK